MSVPDRNAEKRQHPRRELYSAVLLVLDGNGYLSEVMDLSAGGARVGRPSGWISAQRSRLRLFFIFDQDTVIGVDAQVVREMSDHLGLQFLPDQTETIDRLLYESRFSEKLFEF